MVSKSNDVIKPRIIVVPMLKNVEETIAGITNKKEKGLNIPPVNKEERLTVSSRTVEKGPRRNL